MNKEKVLSLRQQLEAALQPFAKENNLAIKFGTARFGSTAVTFKVDVAEISASGDVMSKEVDAFKKNAMLYGLKPEDLGRTFSSNGRTYRIKGLMTRSHRYPILCEDLNKKTMIKFPSETVARALR